MAEKDAVVISADDEAADAEALEFLKADQEATKDATDEGESEKPSPDAAGEETDVVATSEADEGVPSDKEATKERFQELTKRLSKYEKYSDLIDMFEEQPDLARKVVAKRLGLVESEAVKEVAPQQPTQEQIAAQKQYWEDHMRNDPVGTIAHIIREEIRAVNAPTKAIGVKSLIREYKADRRGSEDGPLFKRYEAYFDAFVKSADPGQIESDPDTALVAIENMAFGTWAREERAKAARAKKGKQPVARETPRSLETSRGEKTAQVARPKRALTDEEKDLADLYGEELVAPDEDEHESVWGR